MRIQDDRMNPYFSITAILAGWASGLLFAAPAQAEILFKVDYENGDYGDISIRTQEPGGNKPPSLCCPQAPWSTATGLRHSAVIVNAPARSGAKAVKLDLRPTDEGFVYSEYSDPVVRAEFERGGLGAIGDTRWYGFSVFVPNNWTDSTDDPNETIMFQASAGQKPSCAETWAPHLAIGIRKDLKWNIVNKSNPNPCGTIANTLRVKQVINAVQKGVWTDWAIHIKWSYNEDGFLRLYQNGNLVFSRTGPVTMKGDLDSTDVHAKWGIYKSRWHAETPVDTFIAYYDEFKIGNANSSLAEISPGAPPVPSVPPAKPRGLRFQ